MGVIDSGRFRSLRSGFFVVFSGAYETLETRSNMLADGLSTAAAESKIPVAINRVGSMLSVFFTRRAGATVRNYADATSSDTQAYAKFFHAMLDNGIYLPPSQYEAWFVGLAHSDEIIEQSIKAAERAFGSVIA